VDIKTIAVVGAGVMGTGVAQAAAQGGFDVLLLDVSDAVLEKARQQIAQQVRFYNLFARPAVALESDAVLARITFAKDYSALSGADFLVENVPEKWDLKKDVYGRLDGICPEHCIFAANTSALSITRIASATTRPDRVLGMHFMNPVPLKKMVEVIRGFHTSDATLERAKQFLSSLGKTCVVVNDLPGFVSNRVLMITINEAIFVVQDQVAPAADVDLIFRACFEHKMGPLETADLIGLDTILYSLEVLYESYNDTKYRPCPLLRKMVDAGLRGRKSGHGFYSYTV